MQQLLRCEQEFTLVGAGMAQTMGVVVAHTMG